MVDMTMDVQSWLRKQLQEASPDLLRAMVREFAEGLMGAEADALCGAPYGERSPERVNIRNGYRERAWDTRVGTSGGAMVATPDFGGETYDDSDPLAGSDRALGLVDFSLFPHLEREDMPDTSLANIERWAAGIPVPAYAIDDQTAIQVVDGTVEVVSEGHWKLFTP